MYLTTFLKYLLAFLWISINIDPINNLDKKTPSLCKIFCTKSIALKQSSPVMGHIGLLPQSSKVFKLKGKNLIQKKQILQDAMALSNSGAIIQYDP